ncbi:hypothetical protein Tsubulata_032657, partial [Turnera subulata]
KYKVQGVVPAILFDASVHLKQLSSHRIHWFCCGKMIVHWKLHFGGTWFHNRPGKPYVGSDYVSLVEFELRMRALRFFPPVEYFYEFEDESTQVLRLIENEMHFQRIVDSMEQRGIDTIEIFVKHAWNDHDIENEEANDEEEGNNANNAAEEEGNNANNDDEEEGNNADNAVEEEQAAKGMLFKDYQVFREALKEHAIQGLTSLFDNELSFVDHRFCLRHLWCNFKKQWPSKTFKDYLWNAARSYTENAFNYWMGMLKGLPNGGEEAFAWLMRIDTKLWARHKMSPITKCELLLNNLAETFNSLILETRDKPIKTMLEGIRRLR